MVRDPGGARRDTRGEDEHRALVDRDPVVRTSDSPEGWWSESASEPADDEETGNLGSGAATSASSSGLVEVAVITLRDEGPIQLAGHLETEAEQGADGRTSANGSYRSPDAQAAVPFDRHQSSALQQGDQSEQVS